MLEQSPPRPNALAEGQSGFSLIELLIVLAVLMILVAVSPLNPVGIGLARAQLELNGEARTLASRLERARYDAYRRRAGASLIFEPPSGCEMITDLNGDGVPETETVPLPAAVTIDLDAPLSIAFDWRGRLPADAVIPLHHARNSAATSGLLVTRAGAIVVEDSRAPDSVVPVAPTPVPGATLAATDGVESTIYP